jgi:hypothetical protein
VQQEDLAQLPADGVHRIQRGHRLLEDHADAGAADALHLLRRQGREVEPVEQHLAALDAAHRLRQQAHDGEGGHALAAAGFADDAEGAAAGDGSKLTPSTAVSTAGVGVEGR